MLEACGSRSSRLLQDLAWEARKLKGIKATRGLVSAIIRRAISSMLHLAGSHLRFEKAHDRPWGSEQSGSGFIGPFLRRWDFPTPCSVSLSVYV